MRWSIVIAFLAVTAPASTAAHGPAEAKYLGNEGVLVARGDTKILFDAFYAESFDGRYTLVPGPLEAAMMKGEAPFDGVDAIFITHIHPDHFNSRKTIAYMRAHPEVRLYAGMDVVGAIRAADASSDPLMQRVVAVHVPAGEGPRRFSVEGLEVEAYAVPHSGLGPIPHHAFRVTLDGATTVMHLGDADASDRHFAPHQDELDKKATHAAFVPDWFLSSEAGRRVLSQQIRPRQTIGIHVHDEARKAPDAARMEAGGDLFVEPGETRAIGER